VPDPCPAVYCEKGTVCVYPGECVPDPCPLVSCPTGTFCEVLDDGSARCRYRNVLPEPVVFTVSGKVGCTCAAGGAPPDPGNRLAFPGLLLLLGLFLARFRGVK
jgi:MYXO-CTERM domain-containing protein